MTCDDQDIRGLEAAYKAVFKRELKTRVAELTREYEPRLWDHVCCELNPNNAVPCFWTLTELYDYYDGIDYNCIGDHASLADAGDTVSLMPGERI